MKRQVFYIVYEYLSNGTYIKYKKKFTDVTCRPGSTGRCHEEGERKIENIETSFSTAIRNEQFLLLLLLLLFFIDESEVHPGFYPAYYYV
jgi:hypothetical protein